MSLSFVGRLKQNLFLQSFGLLKIPMIAFVGARVVDLDDTRCEVKIPLHYRTGNHLKCMYFGVLCAGADIAGGLLAMELIRETGNQVNLLFKDFNAEFLKRAESDVHFVSNDGEKVRALVHRALETGERVNETVTITAHCPKISPDPVAKFRLTISLKKRASKAA